MQLKHIQKCRVCGNPNLEEVLDLGEMHSQGFFIYKNKPHPPVRKIPTKLVRCDNKKFEDACGLVQNKVIVPPEILYSNYGYLSGVNQQMINHLEGLSKEILKLKSPDSSFTICDLGANDGTFLKFFGSGVRKIGIDPSDIAKSINDPEIKIINECFPTPKLQELLAYEAGDMKRPKVDVFTAFACLYDMFDLNSVIRSIHYNLSDNGMFVFEVAYLPTVLKDLCYDGLVHEHVSLFSLFSLEFLLKKNGLTVFKARKTDTNSGSLLVYACKSGVDKYKSQEEEEKLSLLRVEEFDLRLDEPEPYFVFRNRLRKHGEDLTTLLRKLKKDGKQIHIYGASTKLNTLLYTWGIGPELITCAAERDERKWGGQLLNGIPIVSEEESRKTVEVYLVGPVHFRKSILDREKELLGRGVKFLFPLPQVDLVGDGLD